MRIWVWCVGTGEGVGMVEGKGEGDECGRWVRASGVLRAIGEGGGGDDGRVDLQVSMVVTAKVLLDDAWRDADTVLPLPILDEVEGLQRRDNIFGTDRGHLRELLDRDRALVRLQDGEEHVRPVRTV